MLSKKKLIGIVILSAIVGYAFFSKSEKPEMSYEGKVFNCESSKFGNVIIERKNHSNSRAEYEMILDGKRYVSPTMTVIKERHETEYRIVLKALPEGIGEDIKEIIRNLHIFDAFAMNTYYANFKSKNSKDTNTYTLVVLGEEKLQHENRQFTVVQAGGVMKISSEKNAKPEYLTTCKTNRFAEVYDDTFSIITK